MVAGPPSYRLAPRREGKMNDWVAVLIVALVVIWRKRRGDEHLIPSTRRTWSRRLIPRPQARLDTQPLKHDACRQQFPPSDGDCHTPLPCEGVKGTIPRRERAVLTARHPGVGKA